MQTSIETLSKLERRLDMAVPAEQIDREVEQRLRKLSRTVRIDGFRPGKVPLKIVAQRYGPQVRSEVIGDAVQKAFSEVVKDQKLKVAGGTVTGEITRPVQPRARVLAEWIRNKPVRS